MEYTIEILNIELYRLKAIYNRLKSDNLIDQSQMHERDIGEYKDKIEEIQQGINKLKFTL
jgi:hypothetical protein